MAPTKKQVIIGASAVTVLMLMRMAMRRKSGKKGSNSSVAERYAFPVIVKAAIEAELGIALSATAAVPPRMTVATVAGMPTDETNPVETAFVIVDAVTKVASAAATGTEESTETPEQKVFAALTAEAADEAATVAAIKAYVLAACPHMADLTAADKAAATCVRVPNTAAAVSTAVVLPTLDTAATKKQRAEAELKAQQAPIDLVFGYSVVAANNVAVYVAPIIDANVIISLVIVGKEGANKGALVDKETFAAMLQQAFAVPRAAVTRLAEEVTAKATSTVANILPTAQQEEAEGAKATEVAAITVLDNTTMKIRAVLPTAETTVETVRCPAVAGSEELLITIKGHPSGIVDNYARISYLPTMPDSWEDDKAITDPAEKEDEYKRSLMAHFLGYISNSITLHPIDISGRKCLWFGEQQEGVCCRTYVCPNFEISGKQNSKKKGSSNATKGMAIIRWEGPSEQWEKSLTVLNNFLDYFQFQ